MPMTDVCAAFGVGQSTASTKARVVSDALHKHRMDPAWMLLSIVDQNPLVWMAEAGLLVFRCIQMIHCGMGLLVFPAKAGIHFGMGIGLRRCDRIFDVSTGPPSPNECCQWV